jgi:transaldolase
MQTLRVKVFADGADRAGMLEMYRNPLIAGFTTNPTLMRKAGIADYAAFARDILAAIPDRPISFEVFSDEFADMERQARLIASWGRNVYVKIPITNTRGESTTGLAQRLSDAGIRVNVTAMMTLRQVEDILPAIRSGPGAYVSIFAGRLADSGRDPVPVMKKAVALLAPHPHLELIWASPREVLNLVQADRIGCHIITMTNDLIRKIPLLGKDPTDYSLETVRMFFDDASKAGFRL